MLFEVVTDGFVSFACTVNLKKFISLILQRNKAFFPISFLIKVSLVNNMMVSIFKCRFLYPLPLIGTVLSCNKHPSCKNLSQMGTNK